MLYTYADDWREFGKEVGLTAIVNGKLVPHSNVERSFGTVCAIV